jgi:hypothetical protein
MGSSSSFRKNGAIEKIGAPLRLQSFRTETSGTIIQKNTIRERLKRLAATHHEAIAFGIIPFRLPVRAQCG